MAAVVRILIVDDSAYVRKSLKQIFSRSPFLEVVGAARHGAEALDLVEQLKPDVVTLDLNMPHMGGLTFLREQMSRHPLPVVVVSSMDVAGELVLQALEAGAIDVIQKPTALATEKVLEIGEELIAKVKAAAGANFRQPGVALPPSITKSAPARAARLACDVIVIGVSTGGPQALKYLLPQFSADFPVPLAIVVHMPVGYTELFARSLNDVSQLEVIEAHEGALLRPGRVLLAPAGRHLTFQRSLNSEVSAHLDVKPLDTPHRPAVDVLFQSAAEVFGSRVLGVVMTGMGSDGTTGAARIKERGGTVFAEAEETCVVYGMPRSVIEADLCDRIVPLHELADALRGAV
ncbi:MAG TPA: chemotaxis response regulator protein-glutamate methylesterase [Planctomycetaceae bacterium]|jgi:two-component system chemotaxis response regulator CheB